MRIVVAASVVFSLSVANVAAGGEATPAPVPVAPVKTLSKLTAIATRTEEEVDAVPATVSVIDSEQIERQLATDIKDLVRFEPGVAVRNSPARFTAAGSSTGRDGNSGFNIRGLEGNRVLMLVDGVRVADAFSFGAQSVGRGDYVDLGLLKSVEILRGPASALYGSDGVAGAVSFTTKDPGDLLNPNQSFTARFSAGYAQADQSFSESVASALRTGQWQALLAYTRRDGHEQETKGTNDAANTTRTTAIPQEVTSNAVLAKLLFQPDQANTFRLTLDHLDRRTDSNVFSAIAVPPLTATSTLALSARDDLDRNRISFDHRYQGAGVIDSANSALYFQRSETVEYSAEDRNTAADRIRDNSFDNDVFGLGVQLNSGFDTGAVGHWLSYGVDGSRTRQEGVRDGTVPPAGESYPTKAFPTTDYTLAGLYVQDELMLLDDRLKLYPALRYDYYSIRPKNDPLFTASVPASQSDTHATPKLGVVLQTLETLNVFANYAQGYKAPTPSQVNTGFTNLVSNYRSQSNPNLKPETSTTLEAGVRFKADNFSSSLTAFKARYQDFIEQVQIGGNFTAANPAVYQYINLSRADIRGVELTADATLPWGFGVQTAASYAQGDYTASSGGERPLNSVEPWKLVAGLKWNSSAQRVGAQLIATHAAGKQATRIDQTCSPSCFASPAFTVLDATASIVLTPQITVRVAAYNLTDKKYWWWSDVRGQSATAATLDAYTQPGRNFSAALSVKL